MYSAILFGYHYYCTFHHPTYGLAPQMMNKNLFPQRFELFKIKIPQLSGGGHYAFISEEMVWNVITLPCY